MIESHVLKSRVEKQVATGLNELGFYKIIKSEGFFVRRVDEQLTLGIFPRLFISHSAWELEFLYGTRFTPIEIIIDILGGNSLKRNRLFGAKSWTTCSLNLNVPPTFFLNGEGIIWNRENITVDGESQSNLPIISRNVQVNLDRIKTLSLPELERLTCLPKILHQLQKDKDHTPRLPVAYFLMDALDQCEFAIEYCRRAHEISADHPFYRRLFRACEVSRESGVISVAIDDTAMPMNEFTANFKPLHKAHLIIDAEPRLSNEQICKVYKIDLEYLKKLQAQLGVNIPS